MDDRRSRDDELVQICAWCGASQPVEGGARAASSEAEDARRTTHGICDRCWAVQVARIDQVAKGSRPPRPA
jgi:hypothetical protein